MIKRLLLFLTSIIVSVTVSLVVTYLVALRPMRRTWGVDAEESTRTLPGDDLVADAPLVETRGITVEAPPSAVWPWLVQMGFGRGGWYSYDRMDNDAASSDRILPEYQSLAVGDTIPAWPGGGFRVAAIDPGRSLVLYLDTDIVKAQQEASKQTLPDEMTRGLKAAGTMGDFAMPEFRASWAFALEPLDGGRARIVERLRAWTPEPSAAQKLALPFFGMGVFLMTRRQLLGLKERAERGEAPTTPAEPVAVPIEAGQPATL